MKIKKLNRIVLESRLDEFIKILENELDEYWNQENFLKELNEKWNFSLFIENDNKIVGYIIASKKSRNIHIHKFMVHRDLRSKGIGYKLLKEIENLCLKNGESLISLKVYKKNTLALKFYLRSGFKIEEYSNDKLISMYKYLKK